MMDIIQKFIHLQIKEEKKRLPDDTEQVTKKKTLIFPRYHQLDVVRKLIAGMLGKKAAQLSDSAQCRIWKIKFDCLDSI